MKVDINALSEDFRNKYERFIIGCDAQEDLALWNKDALGEMESMDVPEIGEDPAFRAALEAAGLDGERIELAVLIRSLCPDPGPEKDEAFLASLPEGGACGDEDLFRAAGTAYGLELSGEDREALLSLRDDAQNEIRNTETGKESEHERNGQGNG